MKNVAYCIEKISASLKKGIVLEESLSKKYKKISNGFTNGKNFTDEEIIEINDIFKVVKI